MEFISNAHSWHSSGLANYHVSEKITFSEGLEGPSVNSPPVQTWR